MSFIAHTTCPSEAAVFILSNQACAARERKVQDFAVVFTQGKLCFLCLYSIG